jgi:TatD DNase family protein
VAIGETGLDNFREFTAHQAQRWAFGWHLDLGAELRLPVVIHDRDADVDIRASLAARSSADNGRVAAGVLHSFCGDDATMRAGLEAGFAISFSGMVTFKNKGLAYLADLVRQVPDDALLVETDCPYLAPAPYRGRRNEPAFVCSVASRVAELRGVQLDDIARLTTANACRVFPRIGGLDVA